MDRPDLEALGAELQRDLRLQDWRVRYLYVRDLRADQFQAWAEGREASGAVVYGLCDRLVDNKTATILIRDPVDPLPLGAAPKTPEETLVHELVHLHMAPLAENTPAGVAAEEQAVWPIADEIARLRATARGSARANMIARAMAMRGPQIITKERTMGAHAKVLAMLKAAAEADGAKEDSAMMRALAAAMADDEKPVDGDGDEAKKARAAAEEEERKAKAARAAAEESRTAAAQVLTAADVEARAARAGAVAAGEVVERAQIIERNRTRLGQQLATELATLPLGTVKSIVAARLQDSPATDRTHAARPGVGALPPVPTDPLASVPPEDRDDTAAALKRCNRLMGLEPTKTKAIHVDSRGMALSHLGDFEGQLRATVEAEKARVAAGGR